MSKITLSIKDNIYKQARGDIFHETISILESNKIRTFVENLRDIFNENDFIINFYEDEMYEIVSTLGFIVNEPDFPRLSNEKVLNCNNLIGKGKTLELAKIDFLEKIEDNIRGFIYKTSND